ncbi:MFS transporter [Microlunatus elymi]|uniref:MFS transporter n=1 Tax=Microlunatus elymi TaxID=2596828 RepID=A0A516Q129_9ACTN|nr:MFS transporter [Microlunatus elymi]QDP97108.1 MFS transporter [Microlunatus elymi]
MWKLLRRNPRYARLWSGESVSMFGDQVTALALPMIAIMLLHAPAWQLGLLTAASWIPYLFALPIGTLVDRIRTKRLVLVAADLCRALLLATIPVAFVLHRLGFGQLIMVAILVGLAAVVSQTAYVTFFVRVIDTDDVMAANSLNSTARSATGLAGPPAAGWLIQALGAPLALIVDCGSYLVSAATLARLRVTEPKPQVSRQRILGDALDGLRTLLRDRWQSTTLWCTACMNLANFAILAIVLVFATRSLGLTPAAIGTAQGIGATGALIGALLAGRVSSRIGLFPTTMIGSILFSLPFLPLVLTPAAASNATKIILYAGCTFLITGGIMLYDITINTVLVKVTPDHMRGRIAGAFSSINYGIRPAGALLGGVAAELWGTRITIAVAACVGLLAVLPLLRSPLRGCRTMADVVPTSLPSKESA